jgi:ribosomal-protein-alanine N-acetyltransferase
VVSKGEEVGMSETGRAVPVTVRPLRESDIDEEYAAWFHDEAVTRFLESRELTVEDCLGFFREGRETGRWLMYAIEVEPFGVVGTVKLGPIDHRNGISDLVTVIGKPAVWGKGVGQQAIRQVSELAFAEFGLRKLSGAIYSGNVASIRAYTGAGWVVEGRLRDHEIVNGEVQDRVFVSCFNPGLFRTKYGN